VNKRTEFCSSRQTPIRDINEWKRRLDSELNVPQIDSTPAVSTAAHLAEKAALLLLAWLNLVCPHRFERRNPWHSCVFENVCRVQARARGDGCRLNGWATNPRDAVGTVILTHGFREDSQEVSGVLFAEKVCSATNMAIVAVDLRWHGGSHKFPPTFGLAESWDLSGAMDWAETNGYPHPYVLCGGSLGGLAVQLCAGLDERVSGAFIKSSPPSAAAALSKGLTDTRAARTLLALRFLARRYAWLTRTCYRRNIIAEGDISRYDSNPSHSPLIFYLVGELDKYGYAETKASFAHWYPDDTAFSFEALPSEAPLQRKWFRTMIGRGHRMGSDAGALVTDYACTFFRHVLQIHRGRGVERDSLGHTNPK